MPDFVLYLPSVLIAFATFSLGALSPGPNVMAIMGTSMSKGRKAGTAIAFGMAFGSLSWALLTAFGLAALLLNFTIATTIVRILGTSLLLWLAYKAFKSATSPINFATTEVDVRKASTLSYFLKGYAIQMTNPKSVMTWIAVLSLGMSPDAPLWVVSAIVAGTFTLSVIIHLTYARVFSARPMVDLYLKFRRKIQATLGCVFVFAGYKVATSG